MADIEPHLASRTIESICTIPGTRIPSIPPIPPDSIPNEDEIRRWYDNNFAPSLDKLLDSGSSKWFATRGFKLLFNDRSRLGSVLAYLTLVSNHGNNPSTDNASLASQEARVTWMLLELCVRSDQDGGEEADKLARRCQALGAILTAQPLTNPTASLADFVHQDETEPETKMGAFERQVARRADEFWKLVEKAAANQAPDGSGVSLTALRQIQPYRDQQENRDIIYSIMLLGSTQAGQSELSSEQGLVRTFLQNEARGRATNLVFSTLSGMALRAFPS